MNVNLTTVMRERVPVKMQGRVTSAQDTLKNCTIPLGLFLGGILADYVFEPFMKNENILSGIFGIGHGAGIAMIFVISGLSGMIISLIRLTKPVYKELDPKDSEIVRKQQRQRPQSLQTKELDKYMSEKTYSILGLRKKKKRSTFKDL